MIRFGELSTNGKRYIHMKINRNRMMNTNETKNFKNNYENLKKKFVEKLKLTDLKAIEIIKKIFAKRNIESNTFTHEFIIKKLIKII